MYRWTQLLLVGCPSVVAALTGTAAAQVGVVWPDPPVSGTPAVAEKFTQISSGAAHMGLRPDGTIRVWTTITTSLAVPALPSDVTYTHVSAGWQHLTALRSDGNIVAWDYWPPGQGDTWTACVPPLPGSTRYVAVSAGEEYTVALRSDGKLVGWGKGTADPAPINCNTCLNCQPCFPPETPAPGFSSFTCTSPHGTELVHYATTGTSDWAEAVSGGHHAWGRKTSGEWLSWGSCWCGQRVAPTLTPPLTLVDVFPGHRNSVYLVSDSTLRGTQVSVCTGCTQNNGNCNPGGGCIGYQLPTLSATSQYWSVSAAYGGSQVVGLRRYGTDSGKIERLDSGTLITPPATSTSSRYWVLATDNSSGSYPRGLFSPCYADCDGSCTVTSADLTCFQNAFVAGSPFADCNNDGNLDVSDFGCYQTKVTAGCSGTWLGCGQ